MSANGEPNRAYHCRECPRTFWTRFFYYRHQSKAHGWVF